MSFDIQYHLANEKKQLSKTICQHTILILPLADIIVHYSLPFPLVILDQAVLYHGVAFGGFVRDWVIRGQKFKDLDLWFKNENDANKFIASLFPKKLNERSETKYIVRPVNAFRTVMGHFNPITEPFEFKTASGNDMWYNFSRMELMIGHNSNASEDMNNFLVDIIVSPTCPTNDFDINCLTYDGVNLQYGLYGVKDDKNNKDEKNNRNLKNNNNDDDGDSDSDGDNDDNDDKSHDRLLAITVDNIKKGIATMLPSYLERMSDNIGVGELRVHNFMRRKVFHITNFRREDFKWDSLRDYSG